MAINNEIKENNRVNRLPPTPDTMFNFQASPPPPPLIQYVIQEKKEEPKPKKKVTDPNNCEPAMYWAREAPYYCIPKPHASFAQSPVRTAVRAPQAQSKGNTYTYGYCTWYVKNRRPDIPNGLGDANNWYYAYNGSKGTTPRAGAVGVAKAYTHVVYIEKVEGSRVYVSEYNYTAWNTLSYRWTSASEFRYLY